MKKPKINYPCNWEYRIIGKNRELLEEAALEVINDRDYRITLSNKSKTGKFVSLNVKTEVFDESDRNNIFASLGDHPAVKIVL